MKDLNYSKFSSLCKPYLPLEMLMKTSLITDDIKNKKDSKMLCDKTKTANYLMMPYVFSLLLITHR